MISKEEFINKVNSSISFSASGYPYFIVEDKYMVCPFCEQSLKNKKILGSYQLKCTCKKSEEFAELYLNHFKNIEKEKIEINFLEKKINELALTFFKNFFRDNLIPKLKEEFNKNIDEILNS
jgi:hypothetical protein